MPPRILYRRNRHRKFFLLVFRSQSYWEEYSEAITFGSNIRAESDIGDKGEVTSLSHKTRGSVLTKYRKLLVSDLDCDLKTDYARLNKSR